MAERPRLYAVPRLVEQARPDGAGRAPDPGSRIPRIDDVDSERHDRDRGFARTVLPRLAALLLLSVVAAFVLAPRLVKGDLPTDASLLGTPARGVVKADRDYALIDEAATSALRDEAAGASLPVWDLDPSRNKDAARALQKSLVRIAVALEPMRRGPVESRESRESREPREAREGARAALEPGSEPLPRTASTTLEPVRAVIAGEFTLAGIEALRDEAWGALVDAIWRNPALVDVVVAQVSDGAADPTVDGPHPTAPSIVVRAIADGSEQVIESAKVLDVGTARAHLRAAAAGAVLAAVPGLANGAAQSIALLVSSTLRPTLTWNAAETGMRRKAAASSVPPVVVHARRGETVLRPGEIITSRHHILAQAMAVQQATDLRVRATLGTAAFVALVSLVVYLFGARRVFRRHLRSRDVFFLCALLMLQLLTIVAADAAAPFIVARIPSLSSSVIAYAIPIALGAMAVRVTLPPDVALLYALVTALLGGVVVEPGMGWSVVAVLSSMTGAAFVTHSPRRSTVMLSGLGAGLVGMFAALTLELFRGALQGVELAWLLGATLVGGVLSGVLALVVTPLVELMFGYVTDPRLYRLADMNHPLLKELIVHAPGTWHHSVGVAVLAEQAASAVGANPLLARVMALYHDVGKIGRPQSFRENNATADDPHARLSPEESATILRGHVEEGLQLAQRHGIPRAVAAAIEEHHVDNRMDAFFEAARARALDAGLDPGLVDEQHFRYRGRPPQTRESALVMLADQIEAASRTLIEPSPAHLADVVDAFVNRALTSDTLEACDLSLRDLHRARAALKRALLDLRRAGGTR